MPQNPPELPVRDFPSPEILDGLIVEYVDNNKGDYKPIPVGTRIPEGADSIYAGYELVSQKTTGDYRWVQRFWANAPRNESVYNASVDDDEGDSDYPIITRRSVVRRPYTAGTIGSILGQVLGAVVTNGGSGYITPPVVTLSGNGAAEAIIYRGEVVYIRITDVGSGYAAAPSVSFSGGGGAGAAASAYIQTADTELVSEKLEKLPQDDPRFGLYDVLVQVYLRLPGPRIVRKGYDLETKAAVRTTKQRVSPSTLPTALETSEVFNAITMYCKDSSVVPIDEIGTVMAYLTETFMELPTAVLTVWDQDEETLVNIKTTYEVVLLSSITEPATHTTGIIISYKKIDGTTALKIIRDYTEFLDFEYTEQRFAGGSFPDLWDYANFFWTNGCGSFNHERSQFSDYVRTRVTIYFTAAVQEIVGLTIQPNTIQLGHAVNQVNVLNDAGSIIYAEPDCTGIVSFPASDPSYTDYIDTIQGTYQLRSGESALWKALIWRNMEVEIWML